MNSIDCTLNREITFIDLDKQELFKLPSWNYIRENGGLKNIFNQMGRDYETIVNLYAFQQTLFRTIFFPPDSRDGCKWLTPEILEKIHKILENEQH